LVVLPSGQKHIWVNVVKGADLSDAKSIIWVEGHLETCCSSLNGNDEKQKDLESIFFSIDVAQNLPNHWVHIRSREKDSLKIILLLNNN
jgi:hypothetical protein